MGGNQGRGVAENAGKRTFVVDQHVTGRCAHENFDTTGGAGWQCADYIKIVVGRTQVKSVIGQ